MMDNPEARKAIARLKAEYGLTEIHDPGGIELRHPDHGACRLTGEDDDADLATLTAWVEKLDEKLGQLDDTNWNDWEGIDY